MYDRRNCGRHVVDMPVTKVAGPVTREGFASDISPTGVRLRRLLARAPTDKQVSIELHVVPGAMSTVVTARRIWFDDDYEGFEFVDPSFAQQAMLERVCGNF
jgi:hypothetical protein